MARRDLAERLASLAERLDEVAEARARPDPALEADLSEAEMERAGLAWWAYQRAKLMQQNMHAKLNQPGGFDYKDPAAVEAAKDEAEAELQQRYGYGDEVAAKLKQYSRELSDEAHWLACREQHGPGLCEVDCPGLNRHRAPVQRQDRVERAPVEPEAESRSWVRGRRAWDLGAGRG